MSRTRYGTTTVIALCAFKRPPLSWAINATASGAELYVHDTFTRGTTTAISALGVNGSVDRCRFERSLSVAFVISNGSMSVRDSVITMSGGAGVGANAGGNVDVENYLITFNQVGVAANGGQILVAGSMITRNTTGVSASSGGTVLSFGNNRLAANGTNGNFSGTIPQQ